MVVWAAFGFTGLLRHVGLDGRRGTDSRPDGRRRRRRLGGGGRCWWSPPCRRRTPSAAWCCRPPSPATCRSPAPRPGRRGSARERAGCTPARRRAGPASAASSASPARSTPPSGPPSATRSSSGSAPTGRPFWIAETFDHWTGQSWTEAQPAQRIVPVARGQHGLAVPHPAPRWARRTGALRTTRPSTSHEAGPNLVFHAANADRGLVPGPPPLRRPTTAPSARARRWGPAPSTPCCPACDTADRRRALRGRRDGADRASGLPTSEQASRSSSPTPTRGWPPWPAEVTANATTVYAKVVGARALDRGPHQVHDRHPAAGPGPGHGRPVPLRQPARLLRADQHRRWP